MRGSRKFFQRGSNVVVRLFVSFLFVCCSFFFFGGGGGVGGG